MRRSSKSSLCCLFRLWSELHALPASRVPLCCPAVYDMIGPQTLVFIVSHSSRGAHICSGSNVREQFFNSPTRLLSTTCQPLTSLSLLPGRQSSHRHRYIQFSRRRLQSSKLHLVFHSSAHKLNETKMKIKLS